MAIERLQVILELVTGNYKREAAQAATATGGISRAASGVTGALKSMIGPAAIGGAVVGLVNMAEKAGENADRLFDLAAQTGLSTDALQEYEFVAKTAGANTEVFSDAVKAIIKNLSEAAGGTGAAADAYETLGIKVLDSSGKLRSAGDITDEVFLKLAGMEDITQRNALAQDIFGKKWEETISVLDLGSDAIAGLREEGKKGVISQEALRNADKFREAWAKLQAILGPKLFEALGNIAPALTEIAEGAVDAFDAMEPLIDALGFVAQKFGEANDAIDAGRESPSEWAQRWAIASDIGKGYIFGVVGALGALFDEENVVKDNTVDLSTKFDNARNAAHLLALNTNDELIPALSGAVRPIDNVRNAQQKAADATRNHVDQIVALTTRLAAAINPAIGTYQALQDLEQAHQDAKDAAAEHGSKSEEAAFAQLVLAEKIAIAEGALAQFGLNAESSVSAIADALGITEDAARTLLDTLGLLDGLSIEMQLVLRQVNLLEEGVIPEGQGISRGTTTTVTASGPFHQGGIVPGRRGEERLILVQGGETVLPINWGGSNITRNGPTINVSSPTNNLRQDLQYAALLANIATLN